jgi:hypothetical protein
MPAFVIKVANVDTNAIVAMVTNVNINVLITLFTLLPKLKMFNVLIFATMVTWFVIVHWLLCLCARTIHLGQSKNGAMFQNSA